MRKNGRDNRPYVKPVKRIELSEKNIKLRWIAIVVLLSVAVVAILTGLVSALNTEPGWQAVEVSSDQANCGSEFSLMYDFSEAGSAATAQYKQLTSLYSEAAVNAYRIFTPDVLEDSLFNVAYLNAHVNETVTVDETLYRALALVAKYEDRHVFTAPAMVEYNRVFLCENEGEAARYVPANNSETASWLAELAKYVRDPEMISLEVLGGNQVRLKVSDAYLAFAKENEIETFLDFGWMKNAFIADYLADVLTENGYTNGYLSSYDGFTRNLDNRGQTYTMNLFDAQGVEIYMPTRMYYSRPMSIVFLRSYPLDELDRWHYFAFENGEVVTALLDPADCMSKSSTENLVSYSTEYGCAEILLQTAPLFVVESFESDEVNALAESGIYSIWFEGWTQKYNDASIILEANEDGGAALYTCSLEK